MKTSNQRDQAVTDDHSVRMMADNQEWVARMTRGMTDRARAETEEAVRAQRQASWVSEVTSQANRQRHADRDAMA